MVLLLLLLAIFYLLVTRPDELPEPFSSWRKLLLPAERIAGEDQGTRPLTVYPPSPVLSVPPEKMRLALAESYRLRPDKRFLLAVTDIHSFLSGQPKEDAAVEFQRDHWVVRYKNLEVGTLPEFAEFSDLLDVLSSWAKSLNRQFPVRLVKEEPADPSFADLERQLDRFLSPHLAAAARQVDTLWNAGKRHPALLKAGTRALVSLSLQGLDRLETSDQLPAKALAVLALTKGLTDRQVTHEESLLAETMGYSAHAVRIGPLLPEDDGARWYVTRDDRRLLQLALSEKGTTEVRYLWLLRVAEQHKEEALLAWADTHFADVWFTPPIFKAGLELNKFATDRTFSEALPHVVLLAVAQEVGIPGLNEIAGKVRRIGFSGEVLAILIRAIQANLAVQTSTLVNHFDSGIQILDRRYHGPFLDSQTYQAYFRGYFFSALYILGLHYLDSLSSAQAASRFAETLGNARAGTAADFQRWYRNLAQSKAGKADPPRLVEDLVKLSTFGVPPLVRSFEEQEQYFQFGDPALLQAVKLLTSHMDTRVRHRFELGSIARKELLDLRLAERLLRSTIETDPSHYESLQVWYAQFTGDRKRLYELLNVSSLDLKLRGEILEDLEQLKAISDKDLRREYQRLLAADRDNWDVRKKYKDYLQRVQDYAEARSVIQKWLSIHDESAGFDYIFARTALAGTYEGEGRYQEGLDAVEPVIKSQQGGAMERAALLLDKLGRAEDAEKMARFVLDRYPDSLRTRTLLLEILWRHHKYQEAATVISSSPYPINAADWRFVIGDRFAQVFRDFPDSEALRAFSSLLESGIGHPFLLELALPVAKQGNSKLAFEMASQLRAKGMQHLAFLLRSYTYLKAWQGKTSALDWLRKRVPTELINRASMIVFEDQEFDLLWELIEEPKPGDQPDFVWLLRAAASLQLGTGKDPHRDKLERYYHQNTSSPYAVIGRYLMGLASEQDVLAVATDAKKRCEIAYYLGLRAWTEGRYDDASDWYRVSVETGLKNNGEYRWAYGRIYVWYTHGKSLSRLAAEKL